jgi:hypothetical protein
MFQRKTTLKLVPKVDSEFAGIHTGDMRCRVS